jgi:hypothetical protein
MALSRPKKLLTQALITACITYKKLIITIEKRVITSDSIKTSNIPKKELI